METAFTKVYNDLIINKSRSKDTLLVMLDLSAAFDTVDQDILLNDLFALGIDGLVLEWFRTYLKNRIFRVCVNDTLSDVVPQGRILDPILFLIYTNKIYFVLESSVVF